MIYSKNEVANNIATTDPAMENLFKAAALVVGGGEEVGDCEGTPPIDDGGTEVGGEGGEFVGDETGGVLIEDFGEETGVETGEDDVGEEVGAGEGD